MDNLPTQLIETIEAAPALPPVEPQNNNLRDVGIVVNRTGAADNYNYITRTYTTIRILEIGQ